MKQQTNIIWNLTKIQVILMIAQMTSFCKYHSINLDSSGMEELPDSSDSELDEQKSAELTVTTTRGGRVATNYRAKDFESLVYLAFSIFICTPSFFTFCLLPQMQCHWGSGAASAPPPPICCQPVMSKKQMF